MTVERSIAKVYFAIRKMRQEAEKVEWRVREFFEENLDSHEALRLMEDVFMEAEDVRQKLDHIEQMADVHCANIATRLQYWEWFEDED